MSTTPERSRPATWPILAGSAVLVLSVAIIIFNYMRDEDFSGYVLLFGLALQPIGWILLLIGVVLFLSSRRTR